MTKEILAVAALLFAASAFADDDDAVRAELAGAWQVDSQADAAAASVWTLEEKSDAVHITYSQGNKKLADFECNTMGRECKTTDSGHAVKVSVWFSGPKLVELETKGNEVLKRRFSVSGEGKTMELEVIPIVPTGKSELRVFKRMQVSSQAH